MKRTIIILLDCLILGGVLPGCGTAIMGIVDILEPEAEIVLGSAGFWKIVPSVADRGPDEYPIETKGQKKPAGVPAHEPGAIAAAMASVDQAPAPASGGAAGDAGAAPPGDERAGPAPVETAPLEGPGVAALEPAWESPIMPAVKAVEGPVERSVAAPGSPLDATVKGLVAKLGPVTPLKTTIHNESGDPARLVALYALSHRELLIVDPIDAEGRVSPKALALFERLLRSVRTDDTHAVDPMLVKLLYAVALAHDGVLMISSGYREPGHGTKPTSTHTKGMAADVKHPYLPAKVIADFARAWGAGGVGYYPKTHFVHLDVREKPFHWIDTSDKGQKGKVVADMDGLLADYAAAKWEGLASPFFNASTEPALDPVEIGDNVEVPVESAEPASADAGESPEEDLPEI